MLKTLQWFFHLIQHKSQSWPSALHHLPSSHLSEIIFWCFLSLFHLGHNCLLCFPWITRHGPTSYQSLIPHLLQICAQLWPSLRTLFKNAFCLHLPPPTTTWHSLLSPCFFILTILIVLTKIKHTTNKSLSSFFPSSLLSPFFLFST